MRIRNGLPIAALVFSVAALPVGGDPIVTVEEAKLDSWLPAHQAFFGSTVAMSGSTLVVGAPNDKGVILPQEGAAYVFDRTGHTWASVVKVFDSQPQSGSKFGRAVAIHADIIAVGAPESNGPIANAQGAVNVYRRVNGAWTFEQRLTASDGAVSDFFGASVAVSGNRVVVGAFAADAPGQDDRGAVYVFQHNGVSWIEQAKLSPSDGAATDWFGNCVAINGGTIVVGSPNKDGLAIPNHGAAYVYVPIGEFWNEQGILLPDTLQAHSAYGSSVAIDGNTIVVGSFNWNSDTVAHGGAAFVYTRSGDVWTQQAQLLASDASDNDFLGDAVAISGNTIVCGAYGVDSPGLSLRGAAYVFTRVSDAWTERKKITASTPQASAFFSRSIALFGDTVAVGASGQHGVHESQGAAFVYRLGADSCCKGDLNASTLVNSDDAPLFAGVMLSGLGDGQALCAADMDGNGTIDGRDIQLFVTKSIAVETCP
jgi:hypothetical protein